MNDRLINSTRLRQLSLPEKSLDGKPTFIKRPVLTSGIIVKRQPYMIRSCGSLDGEAALLLFRSFVWFSFELKILYSEEQLNRRDTKLLSAAQDMT